MFFLVRGHSVTPHWWFGRFRSSSSLSALLIYSSHAPSFPAPCWAGKWLCAGEGSYEREKKERAKKRHRRETRTEGLVRGLTLAEKLSPADEPPHGPLGTTFAPKPPKSAKSRGWVFPKLLHISSTARHCTGKWWKRCKCALRTQLHAVDSRSTFKV